MLSCLKEELSKRGYLYRYKLMDTVEKSTRFYVVSLRNEENYSGDGYCSEKAEEARISIIMNPTINKKYVYSKESSSWKATHYEKDYKPCSYIRIHVSKNTAPKKDFTTPPFKHLCLRQCFDFDNY